MSPAPRALTLLELLVAVAVVAIGAVGAAQLIAHALRLAERAERRSELTVAAHTALERARLQLARGEAIPATAEAAGGVIHLTLAASAAPEGLTEITVAARRPADHDRLAVTLTGWVIAPGGSEP